MEVAVNAYRPFYQIRALLVAVLLFAGLFPVKAQPLKNGVSVGEGVVYLTLNRRIGDEELRKIVDWFELNELPLRPWLKGTETCDAQRYGWKQVLLDNEWLILSRNIEDIGDISKLEEKILVASQHSSGSKLYPAGPVAPGYGFNKLRQSNAVVISGNRVSFLLAGYGNASEVKLAASFTQWQAHPLQMKKTAEGWVVNAALEPGKYLYKFIVDGRWILHKDNLLQENDGRGNMNSVFYVYNKKFELKGYRQASRVYLSGSFNGWAHNEAQMVRTATGWELPVYLPGGTYTYRFNADNEWLEDPAAEVRMKNEFGGYNSVVMVGRSHIFRLDGFEGAKQVVLAGSFNGYREYEIELQRAKGGWEVAYAPGAGNHEYYYLVDGNRIGRMPAGGKAAPGSAPLNFNAIIDANYSFSLKGYKQAGQVYLSGSFNNWSETGFPMRFENGEWKLMVHLPPGKQTYKFIVDGKWVIDPANRHWEQNEHGTKNSVLWIE